MMSDNLKNLLEQYRAQERIAMNKRVNLDMREIAEKILDEIIQAPTLTIDELQILDNIYIDLKMLVKVFVFQTKLEDKQEKPKPKGFK